MPKFEKNKSPFMMKGFSGFGNSPVLAKDVRPSHEKEEKKKEEKPKDTTLSAVRDADADMRKKIKNLDMSKLTAQQKKMFESYMKTGK